MTLVDAPTFPEEGKILRYGDNDDKFIIIISDRICKYINFTSSKFNFKQVQPRGLLGWTVLYTVHVTIN